MDKKTFLNCFKYDDKNIISSIYDKIILAEKCGKTIYTHEFLPPALWTSVIKLKNEFHVEMEGNGVFEEAERKMLAFTSSVIEEYPIHMLRITNKSHFNKLQHKDYLGAIMALGIKREKLGDLVLGENHCYVPVCSEISEYIELNLHHIGKNPCEITVVSDNNVNIPAINFEYITMVVASLRMDCIISAICNVSRGLAVELIEQGKVLLNYEIINEKDYTIKENSVITVRGYGKYKVSNEVVATTKGRLRIKIQKYK